MAVILFFTGANKPKMMGNTAYVSSNYNYISAQKKRKRIAKSTQNHQLFLGYKKRSLKKNMIKRKKPHKV